QRRLQPGLGFRRAHEHEPRRRLVGAGRSPLEQLVEPVDGGVVNFAAEPVVGPRGAEELIERWVGQGLAHLESVSPSADAACEQGSSVESTGAQGTPSGGTEGRQSGTVKL